MRPMSGGRIDHVFVSEGLLDKGWLHKSRDSFLAAQVCHVGSEARRKA